MPGKLIAYFSMEIGLEPGVPTYAGGLGVLAGDTIRAAADLGLPVVAVSLLYRQGYFTQRIDPTGWQVEEPVAWSPEAFAERLPVRAQVAIEGRPVAIAIHRHEVVGAGGYRVPVYFLDTDLPENAEPDRALTHALYAGDARHRLAQEVVLGIGGVRALHALGHVNLRRFHMNEGHAALLVLELLRAEAGAAGRPPTDPAVVEAVRSRGVFTTHTPVPAGHDQFPLDLARAVLGDDPILRDPELCPGVLNMTHLALALSRYVNGVARRHGEVSRRLFPGTRIDAIANGVHAATWTAPPLAVLFDRALPGWRQDNSSLRGAAGIPIGDIWQAHLACKRALIDLVLARTGQAWDPDALTIGAARRATGYKRADLVLTDPARLQRLAAPHGPLQIVFAGKAHPHDHAGKQIIQRIIHIARAAPDGVRIVYLVDYDIALARVLIPGVDLWLNTPEPPMEASGTSGMKAALNGVPSLSTLDGWWVEGCIEGVTGWAIGEDRYGTGAPMPDRAADAAALYDKLERVIVPMFYRDRESYIAIMRQAIALNGSFFNTERMMQQYVARAYFG